MLLSPLPWPGEVARVPRAGSERVRAERLTPHGVPVAAPLVAAPSSGLRPPSPARGEGTCAPRGEKDKTLRRSNKKAPDPPLDAPHITFCAFAVSRLEKET